jgi:ATP-dependent exoDNAse (exonuclease V) beta subunit
LLSGQTSYSPLKGSRFQKPIDWMAALLGVAGHEEESRVEEIGGARLRLSFAAAEEAVDHAPRSEREAMLAAARERVERGEPVRWAGNLELVRPDEISRLIQGIIGPGAALRDARPAPPVTTTVTRLAYYYRCPRVYYYDLVLQVEEHPRARRKSTGGEAERLTAVELGTRVHALLERVDLATDPGVEAERLAASETHISEPDRQRIRTMLDNVLSDPVMTRARQATRLEREYPFYLQLDGSVVQGVIDLLFTDAEGRGVVLDYKSNDLAAPDRVNVLTEYYRPQIELYALAAKKAGVTDPSEAVLYFLNKPVARTLPLDDASLERIEEVATGTLRRIAGQEWDTEPGEKCRNCGYRKRGFCEVGKRWQG